MAQPSLERLQTGEVDLKLVELRGGLVCRPGSAFCCSQVEKASFRTARPACTRKVVCQAEKQSPLGQVGAAVSATVLAAALTFTTVDAAKADVAGLTPCSESKAYNKRQKNEIKALTKRLKQVLCPSHHLSLAHLRVGPTHSNTLLVKLHLGKVMLER